MGIVKAAKLVYEYIRRDEEENIEEVNRAIDGVDVDIKKGDFVAVLGHNGSGKSTLAKHVNGLLLPTEGTVWVGDMDTRDEEHIWDVRKTAGMVFQNPDNQIIGNIVEEDVGFGPENIGVPTDEIWQRVDYALRAVGMPKSRTHSPNKLSGGQKRRVAIAGVLAMEPEVLILDEPTAGLDPRGRDEILDQIDRLHRERHMTIILVSHSMEDVARYADRLIVMNHGQKVFDGAPKEVFCHYRELETMGLAAPQITYLVHDLKENGIDIDDDITTVAEAREAILALRNKLTESSRDKNV